MTELAKSPNGTIPAISHGPFTATPTGLIVLNEKVPEEIWRAYGEGLKRIEGAIQWVIGDWLNFGEKKYGETYSQALAMWPESEYQALRNYSWVANNVELSTRVDNLSWTHHREVAALEPKEQKRWLAEAISRELSVRELHQAITDSKRLTAPSPPQGTYSVIYADPPWPVGSMVLEKWESPLDDKYPTMELEEIARLPIPELAADNCSLFLWTTQTFLPNALDLMEQWGFKYFCCITWHKHGGWTQNGFHKSTEFLLFGYRGNINIEQHGKAIPAFVSEKSNRHSKKPDSIRNLIMAKTPEPRIELFAREEHDGWTVWGNEVS